MRLHLGPEPRIGDVAGEAYHLAGQISGAGRERVAIEVHQHQPGDAGPAKDARGGEPDPLRRAGHKRGPALEARPEIHLPLLFIMPAYHQALLDWPLLL